MITLRLVTHIKAPPEVCFDLSRSIDLHVESMAHSNERAIGGKRNGLIEIDEYVFWKATHFFIRFKMKVRITGMKRPCSFTDAMEEGPFRSMIHHHLFKEENDKTIMTDIFIYEVPLGMAGRLFNYFILKNYMTRLLHKRNKLIKKIAEAKQT